MQNYIWLILGKSGTGKSYLGRYIVSEYVRQKKRKYHIVIDLSDEHFYSGLKDIGFKLTEVNRNVITKDIDWQNIFSKYPNLIIEVTDLLDEEIIRLMDNIGKALFKLGNALLVIDEAHQFFERFHYSEELARLFRGGRKYYIDIMLITQMVVDLGLVARKQANILVSFQLTEKNDVEMVSRYFDIDEEELANLRDYKFILKNLRTGEQVLDKL